MSAAYERWDRISDPPAWTWRVACRAYPRLHRCRRRHETLLPSPLLPEVPVRPRAQAARTEDDVISSDQVRRLLRGLARQQRRVVAWWLIGYRFEEIAQRTRRP